MRTNSLDGGPALPLQALQSHLIVEPDLVRAGEGMDIAEAAAVRLWEAVHHFEQVLHFDGPSPWLGYPRPPSGPLYSIDKCITKKSGTPASTKEIQ